MERMLCLSVAVSFRWGICESGSSVVLLVILWSFLDDHAADSCSCCCFGSSREIAWSCRVDIA